MTWKHPLRGDSLNWLLKSEIRNIRYLALRDLCDLSADDKKLKSARRLAHREGPIAVVLDHMEEEGYWVRPGPGYNPKYRSTVWSLILLAQLGANVMEDQRIGKSCKYLVDHMAGGDQSRFPCRQSIVPEGAPDVVEVNWPPPAIWSTRYLQLFPRR